MLVTVLSLFFMSQPRLPEHPDQLRFGHPGQSRLAKKRGLLRPDGHLFARDEVQPYIKWEPKPGL